VWKPEVPPGTVFSRWTVLVREGSNVKHERLYRCLCECGSEKLVPASALTSGQSRSCGCWKAAVQRARHLTHGMVESRTYRIWHSMRQRCENPKSRAYPDYGGRGISVCPEWVPFEGFFRDMGEAPPGATIERDNNDLGYCKSNCRWASRKVQANNTRRTHRVEVEGVATTLARLAEAEGVNLRAMYYRVIEKKWPVDRAAPSVVARLRKKGTMQGALLDLLKGE
jgi:hypothetical protein